MSPDPKLPTTLGQTQFAGSADAGIHGLHIHSPDAGRFDPIAYIPNPSARPTDAEINTSIRPAAEPVIHPLLMVDDTAILPRDYVVHLRSQKCLCCGTVHEWVDVYARNEVPPTHNLGKRVQNLIAVKGFRYNLPIYTVRIESKPVPTCHECVGSEQLGELLSRLPDPRGTDEWNRTVLRKAAQSVTPAKKPAKEKATSLKSLMKEFE